MSPAARPSVPVGAVFTSPAAHPVEPEDQPQGRTCDRRPRTDDGLVRAARRARPLSAAVAEFVEDEGGGEVSLGGDDQQVIDQIGHLLGQAFVGGLTTAMP